MTPLTELPEPVYLEPAHGRRKARIECGVPGCRAPIIETHMTCDDCFKLIPARLRRENRDLCRQCKAATDNDEALMLVQALRRNALACFNAIIERRESCP